jgi:hypothetical protein
MCLCFMLLPLCLFQFSKNLTPRTRHEEANIVWSNESTFAFGHVVLANIRVRVSASKSLELGV